MFEIFERYGGPCILHESPFSPVCSQRLGRQEFMKFAAKLLGRFVSAEEANTWLPDPNLPPLFLEPIIQRASPLIVHTLTQKALLKRWHGVDAHVTTCCPTHFFSEDELTTSAKQAARDRRGIPAGAFLVSSFGIVDKEKASDSCIFALELLRGWNIPAELYFVGNAGAELQNLQGISALYGVAEHVHCSAEFVDDATYRDFLIASDAAVQLRTYGFGQLSTPLTDCISAGLPSVTTSDMAKSSDAPAYVLSVPDRFSPLQMAEQLALIWESRARYIPDEDARATYLETHNFEYYGKRLIEILGLA
jgi:glycosyltransferase involved in cell wall biosynthesis